MERGVSVNAENYSVGGGAPGVTGERGPLWRVIEPLVREAGLELFDLEAPPSGRGTLRVFIWRPSGEAALSKDSPHLKDGVHLKGVGIDDCVRISKRITNLENVDDVLPGDWLIEVSSPGVNRKLKRPEHFAGAVGERVKLTVAGADGRNEVLTGTLVRFDGAMVELDVEAEKRNEPAARRAVPFGRVQNARVDFLFSER